MSDTTPPIDYARIATLAEVNDIPFESLCERAEEDGARTDQELLKGFLRQPNADWLTTPDAAKHIAMTYSSFMSTMMSAELDYYGITFKSRSRTKPNGKRGCGVLFKRSDLDDVVRLRHAIGSTTIAALRVFQAIKKGVITLAEPQGGQSSEAA